MPARCRSRRCGRSSASGFISATRFAWADAFAAVDIKTGEMLWRDRSVTRATLVGAGNRLVLLDEDGNLALATPGETGLEVHGKVQMLKERAWTAPTLSGTTLFVRDRHQIMALDLGR